MRPEDIWVEQCVYGEGVVIDLTWRSDNGCTGTYAITRIAQAPEPSWSPTTMREGAQVVETAQGPQRQDPSFTRAVLYEIETRSDDNAFAPFKTYSLFVLEYVEYVRGRLQEMNVSAEVIETLFANVNPYRAFAAYNFYARLVHLTGNRARSVLLRLQHATAGGRRRILGEEGFEVFTLETGRLNQWIQGALIFCNAKVVPIDEGL